MGLKINLIPASSTPVIPSKKALIKALKSGIDFIVADISNQWDGKPVTHRELLDYGYTQAQVRYGFAHRKVAFFTNLKELK